MRRILMSMGESYRRDGERGRQGEGENALFFSPRLPLSPLQVKNDLAPAKVAFRFGLLCTSSS
jgi:hypothetical protein